MANETEVKSAIEAFEKLHGVQFEEIEAPDGAKVQIAVIPGMSGMALQSLKKFFDEYLEEPERRKGQACFRELDSFIAHVNRFSDNDSVIFANPKDMAPTLTAVLDYHCAGPEGSPRFGEHRALYEFPLSDEWKAWKKLDGQMMSQTDFAEFLEDRVADVMDPSAVGPGILAFVQKLEIQSLGSPADMLRVSRHLEARTGVAVTSKKNLSTGEVQVNYEVKHNDPDGGPLKVPGAFVIGIPLFRAGERYQIGARMRVRLDGGTPEYSYSLYRTDVIFDNAFKEACQKASDATTRPLFVGFPEQ